MDFFHIWKIWNISISFECNTSVCFKVIIGYYIKHIQKHIHQQDGSVTSVQDDSWPKQFGDGQ